MVEESFSLSLAGWIEGMVEKSFALGLAPECLLNGDGALASLNDFGWVVFGSKHCGQVVGWQDFYRIASCVRHLFHSVNKSFSF